MDLATGASASFPARLPQGVVVDDTLGKVFLTTGDDLVLIFTSADPGRAIQQVRVGRTPKWPGLNRQTHRLYVPNHADHSVSVIDAVTESVVATIDLGRGAPVQAVVDEDADRVYVTNWTTRDVAVIDGATNTVSHRLPLVGDPATAAIDPATGRLYATYNAAGPSGWIAAFDRNGVQVGDRQLSAAVSGIAFDPLARLLYVTNGYNAPCDTHCRSVSVLDPFLDERAVISLPFTPGPGVAVDSATGRVYIANFYSAVEGAPIVLALDGGAPGAPTLRPAAPPPEQATPVETPTAVWIRGYPEVGPSGCVEYVAQWSDGTYTSTPWDCGPDAVARRDDRTASRGYPQYAANGCLEYVTQWSDGSFTWVPFECPPGVIYPKP